MRRILAVASVEGYLRDENYKFVHAAQEYAAFGADLLREIRETMNGLQFAENRATFEDPIGGKK